MHKERIFSASSGRHRGTSSGNMEPCPRRSGVVFLALCAHPHSSGPPFPVLRSQALPQGKTGRSLFLWNARTCAREGRRLRCFRAPACHRQGPSGIAGPVFFFVLCPASFSSFSPVCSGRRRVTFLLRLAERPAGGLPPPMRCVASSLPAAVPVPCLFPLPEGLSGAALFLRSSVLCHASTRHRFRPVQLRPAFLLLSVPRGVPGA